MRDKLVELIAAVLLWEDVTIDNVCKQVADHLIANGVTIQRWIPVNEIKPELIPNSAGTAYSDAVNALTSGRKVITAIWDGEDFIGDGAFWDAEDEIITHWAPVLLPLPNSSVES